MTFGPYINSTKANEYCNVGLRQTYLWTMDEFKNLTYADPLPRTHPGCGNIYGLLLCSPPLFVQCLFIFFVVVVVMQTFPLTFRGYYQCLCLWL